MKKRGIRTDVSRRDEVETPPKVEVIEFWRGSDIVGFMLTEESGRLVWFNVVLMVDLYSRVSWCLVRDCSVDDSHDNLFLAQGLPMVVVEFLEPL